MAARDAAAHGRGSVGGAQAGGPTSRVATSDPWWHSVAHRALEWLAQSGQPFDAYDLTELGVPDPDHPARWGALFAAAQAQGLIAPVGYQPSRRPTRAGGVCRVWVGAVP
ncbi:MAG: hypothetical protein KQH57_07305 [Actinomycetales bacterium]|nr:hypothetical protein [Actinomycetales bacterium]